MSVVKDVARKAGVSPSTVSLVLNNKPGISSSTRQRVFQAMAELGYQDYTPNRGTKNMQRSIQFILYKKHGHVVADTPFFSSVLEGVEAQVKKHGFSLLITYINAAHGVREPLQQIMDSACSGIILLATEMTHNDLLPFTRTGIPLVVLDSYFEEITVDSVVINNRQGSFLATRNLYENGHTEIGYLKSKVAINNFYERKDGYKKALKSCKLPYNTEYIFELGASVETAYTDMKELLSVKRKLPTAFFADNDVIAVGAMRALREAGVRVPQDVSVVGFDDIPMCEMLDVPLTTIRVPKRHIGMLAVDRLVEIICNDTDVRVKIEVRTEIVERSSVLNRNV